MTCVVLHTWIEPKNIITGYGAFYEYLIDMTIPISSKSDEINISFFLGILLHMKKKTNFVYNVTGILLSKMSTFVIAVKRVEDENGNIAE